MTERMEGKGPEQLPQKPLNPEMKEGKVGVKETLDVIRFVEASTLTLIEGLRDGLQIGDVLNAVGRHHKELMEAISGSGNIMAEMKDLGPMERRVVLSHLIQMTGTIASAFFPEAEPKLAQTAYHLDGLMQTWI